MMKVGKLTGGGIDLKPISVAEPHAVRGERQVMFRRTLSELTDRQRQERMAELISRIDEQGKKLAKRTDLAELERYRSMIKSFMDEVLSDGYEFTKENSYSTRGRRPVVVATVRTVNEELDRLAKDVLDSQADGLDILERTGAILGLLIDMTM